MSDIETKADAEKILNQRISDLRGDVVTLDWSDDKKTNDKGSFSFGYLSSDKIRRNLAGLFMKHGLEFEMRFSDLIPYRDQSYWTVKLSVRIFAVDVPGAERVIEVYGESGNPGNMGVIKAQTFAIKEWLTSFFLIADGIESYTDAAGGFTPMSNKEREEVKSRIAKRAIPASAHAEPPAEPRTVVSDHVTMTIVPDDAPAPKAAPAAPAANKGLSLPLQKGIERIMDVKRKAREDGLVTDGEYDAMVAEHDAIATHEDALAFIRKYRV